MIGRFKTARNRVVTYIAEFHFIIVQCGVQISAPIDALYDEQESMRYSVWWWLDQKFTPVICGCFLAEERKIVCYLRRRLASGEGIVSLVVTQCVCVRRVATARRVDLGGEGNALYLVLFSLIWFLRFYVTAYATYYLF